MSLSAFSAPSDEDERKHAGELLETVEVKTGKSGHPRKKIKRLAADKGYDSDAMRKYLKEEGVQSSDGKDYRAVFARDLFYVDLMNSGIDSY